MTGMTDSPRTRMAGMLKTPRSRGMLSGLLLMLLGLWGGLIPFVGPYFDFGFGSGGAWVYNNDRLVLSILPAIAVILGGLMLLFSANRPIALLGSWLAILGGLWFVVGTTIAPLWNTSLGSALGGQTRRIAEQLSFFQGLGAFTIMLASMALGRFLVVGVREARRADAAHAERDRAATAAAARERTAGGSTAAPEWEPQERQRQNGRHQHTAADRTWRVTPPSRR
ncbi:hypothetical protein [Actinomadura opuntiae]|uniref:hypothetical protein n=1 Tax=Actinomadura sp. OS1-43 TaxID=604315 RepID=UPI00255ABA61|nr:hypothetical protein [Actinomadura sp. OS1-43]MDL4820159.1 hypothetical protein [Actinomadura sp. OS1-43]